MSHFVKCPCQNCNQSIEFDADQMGGKEQITAECPHCKMETVLFYKRPPTPPAIKKSEEKPQEKTGKHIEDVIESGARLIFLLGLVAFVFLGFFALSKPTADGIQRGFNPSLLLLAVAGFVQGWLVSLLFKGLAEIIRLLRKKTQNH